MKEPHTAAAEGFSKGSNELPDTVAEHNLIFVSAETEWKPEQDVKKQSQSSVNLWTNETGCSSFL